MELSDWLTQRRTERLTMEESEAQKSPPRADPWFVLLIQADSVVPLPVPNPPFVGALLLEARQKW